MTYVKGSHYCVTVTLRCAKKARNKVGHASRRKVFTKVLVQSKISNKCSKQIHFSDLKAIATLLRESFTCYVTYVLPSA